MVQRNDAVLQNGFNTGDNAAVELACEQSAKHQGQSRQSANIRQGSAENSCSFSNIKCGVQWDASRLYWFEEAPPVLQFNRFVRSGYRAGLTPCHCLQSVLQYHNETGNILTHLIPVGALGISIVTGILPGWPSYAAAFYGNVVPIMLCLGGSVIYHTFMANHPNYRAWITLDICGIFGLFLCGVHGALWWGLRCFPVTRAVYTALYYFVAAVAVSAAVRAKNVMWRAVPMLLLCLFRLGITVLRWALGAGSPRATRHFALMEAVSFLGGFINVCRIPERWFQPTRSRTRGIFDVWFNSHMIMHILVVIAMALLHRGCTEEYTHIIAFPECVGIYQ